MSEEPSQGPGRLQVRLANQQSEIEETLVLRYQVFNVELGEGLPESEKTGKDRDQYDEYCDHLIVLDTEKPAGAQVVGTYRIQRRSTARRNIGLWSEREFDLSPLDHLEDEIAELGRACVHEDYRDGTAFALLWAGLAEYVKKHNVRYLMGMGSVHDRDPEEMSLIYAWLKAKNHLVSEDLRVRPRPEYELKNFDPDVEIPVMRDATRKVPDLIRSYLFAGAKVGGYPAYDYEFKIVDFFLFFDSKEINERHGKHYLETDA